MKILLAVHNYSEVRGQQKFIHDLLNEWAADDVTIYTPKVGVMNTFSEAKVVRSPKKLEKTYDLIIAFHYYPELENHGYLVYYCNDVNADFDQVIEYPVDKFVCISEEIEQKLMARGVRPEIVRNGIDCHKYRPIAKLTPKLRRILLFNYLPPDQLALLQRYCEGKGIELNQDFLTWDNKKWRVEREMNKADLVISVGRGAYEAMACGREVIIWSQFGFDGMVDSDETFHRLLKTNCSGRDTGYAPTSTDDIDKEMKKYNLFNARKNVGRVKKQLNISQVAALLRSLV